MSKQEIVGIHSPIDAVRHAMGIVLYQQTKRAYELLYHETFDDTDDRKLNFAGFVGTSRQCSGACAYALWELRRRPVTAQFFDRYMYITAKERETEEDTASDFVHAYFLVRDTTGVWHAGSPANYLPGKNPSALEVLTGSLSEVVGQFPPFPPPFLCRWPDPKDIEAHVPFAKDLIPVHTAFSDHTGSIFVYEIESLYTRSTETNTVYRAYTKVRYDFSPVEAVLSEARKELATRKKH